MIKSLFEGVFQKDVKSISLSTQVEIMIAFSVFQKDVKSISLSTDDD